MKNKRFEAELIVGIFVTVAVGLFMVAILMLGQTTVFDRNNTYFSRVPSVEGLIVGSKVVLNGLRVGVVKDLKFDSQQMNIQVHIEVPQEFQAWVRKDSTMELATQGLLGDKYIAIKAGSPDQPVMPDGSEIPFQAGKDVTQFLSKSDNLLLTLNSIAGSMDSVLKKLESENRSEVIFKNLAATSTNLNQATAKLNTKLDDIQLKGSLNQLNSILEKVNTGTGTLGALVNDPGLYDDLRALMGGANRNRLMRNLVRQTIKKGDEKSDSAE